MYPDIRIKASRNLFESHVMCATVACRVLQADLGREVWVQLLERCAAEDPTASPVQQQLSKGN